MMGYSDMTYEQAEDVLNDTLHVSANDEIGSHAVYLASIALEKQIKMKPVFKVSKWVSCNNCPRCGSPILPENIGIANYCDDCGQALDWD